MILTGSNKLSPDMLILFFFFCLSKKFIYSGVSTCSSAHMQIIFHFTISALVNWNSRSKCVKVSARHLTKIKPILMDKYLMSSCCKGFRNIKAKMQYTFFGYGPMFILITAIREEKKNHSCRTSHHITKCTKTCSKGQSQEVKPFLRC